MQDVLTLLLGAVQAITGSAAASSRETATVRLLQAVLVAAPRGTALWSSSTSRWSRSRQVLFSRYAAAPTLPALLAQHAPYRNALGCGC